MTKRKENEDECRALEWLRQQGYSDIRRPCNDPPDFVVDGVYAVEATRLSQKIVVGDNREIKSEEESRIPLTRCIKKAISQLGPPANDGSSWVIAFEYDASEPLPATEDITNQILEALAPLLQPYNMKVISDMHSRHFNYKRHAVVSHLGFPHLCLDCGICIYLTRSAYEPAKFIMPSVSDGEGLILGEALNASIENRILDKTTKVRKQGKVGEYKSWWLVLVDHICHIPMTLLSEGDLSFVQDLHFDFWSRVVVVSSHRNLDWHYELLS